MISPSTVYFGDTFVQNQSDKQRKSKYGELNGLVNYVDKRKPTDHSCVMGSYNQLSDGGSSFVGLTSSLERFDETISHMSKEFSQLGLLLSSLLTPTSDETSTYTMKPDLQTCFDRLAERFQMVSKEIDLMKSQVELERNANILRLRSISSLKSTLEEAESQLEQSQKLEREISSLRESNKLIKKHFYKSKQNNYSSKSTQVNPLDIIYATKSINSSLEQNCHCQHSNLSEGMYAVSSTQQVKQTDSMSSFFNTLNTSVKISDLLKEACISDLHQSPLQEKSLYDISKVKAQMTCHSGNGSFRCIRRSYSLDDNRYEATCGLQPLNNDLMQIYSYLKRYFGSHAVDGRISLTVLEKLFQSFMTSGPSAFNEIFTSDLCESNTNRQINGSSAQKIKQLEIPNNSHSKALSLDELFESKDLRSQLTACLKIISVLYNRLSTDHIQLASLSNQLNQCGDSVSVTLSTASQLVPGPDVLDVCSNLTSTSNQLKHVHSLAFQCEQETSDTVQIIYAFQQRLEESLKTYYDTVSSAKHTSVQTDSSTKNETLKQLASGSLENTGCKNATGKVVNYETLLKYGLVSPRNVLNRTLRHSSCTESDEPVKSELQEALLNALSQLDRLKRYRSTQKTRMDQLQERLDHVGSELDASVDTIRYHQTNFEAHKRRSAMETANLRNQLAKTTALLEQYKLLVSKANLITSTSLSQNMRALMNSSANKEIKNLQTHDELQNMDNLSIDDLKLKLSISQNELNQLRLDIVHQREDADREASRLRGQLAEVTSDARALRIQLNRLLSQNVSSNKANGLESTNSPETVSCSNCQKLQRLNDLLQRKQSKMNPIPDLITDQGNMNIKCNNAVSENCINAQNKNYIRKTLDSFTQTDILSCVYPEDNVLKVDTAINPVDTLTDSLINIPVFKCKSTQTESFLMNGDILPTESNLAGEISLMGEIMRYGGGVSESAVLKAMPNDLHTSTSKYNSLESVVSSPMKKSEALTVANCQALVQSSANDLKHSDLSSLNEPAGEEDCSYSLLLRRLKAAEEEAAMAMDQLKSSNAEFLTLRERLSHAIVERAHLKESIDGLDEQVTLLEESLYERTQELHKCQSLLEKYCPTYQKPTFSDSGKCVPEPKSSVPQTISKQFQESKLTSHYTVDSAIVDLKGLLQSYEPTQSFIRSSFMRSNCANRLVQMNDRILIWLKYLALLSKQVTSRISSGIRYTSFRLQSQPRPKPVLICLIYFVFIHLLLLHCWLF
uniref:GOLGA2L5 domain-containing protein n=1 Tax=Trichobilharzia regenti TaxID=157069 RepID=A0AA85KCH6_TRIRE|nr:unnamed protein product [Trichobilharzia regenti]